jgi:hypothetical protein
MSNNKQQTAVEWYIIKRDVLEIEVRLGKLSANEYEQELIKAEQQAKEMEMEQKANTWNNAINAVEKDKWESFEQYYNKTYADGKQ